MPKANTPETFWAKMDKSGGDNACWLWTRGKVQGYGHVAYRGRRYVANRLAWILTHGPIPDGLLVCHKCDVRACCNPSHLFLGTCADNVADMMAKGRDWRGEMTYERIPRGEHSGQAKLTERAVHEIRRLAAEGVTQRRIATMVGVDKSTVGSVIRRETWRHIA